MGPAGTPAGRPVSMPDPVGYQCPYCQLRFAQRWELEHHLRTEHPEAPDPPGRGDPPRSSPG
ncbi:MAG: C2H2-type zinc finger protein [Acidimicrobiales bacterium]|nr:C2H2-type zinc finger protein [Acidimicrobiales bacterium]